MRMISPVLLGLSLAVACGPMLMGQEQAAATVPVSKVLQINREFLKPGTTTAAHNKTEAAFVEAMTEAKSTAYYIAMCSLSGRPRCLYATGYPSYEAWQKDSDGVGKNKELSAKLDEAIVADSKLLESMDQAVVSYEEELSYKATGDLTHARYMEITEYHVRAGHNKDWTDLVKMYISGCEKSGISAHWAMFHLDYGGPGGTYLIFSSDKAMSEIDSSSAEGKKFVAAMGEDGMKRMGELIAAAVESTNTQLFAINPRQSYVPETMIKADPEFWKPAAE